MQTIAIVNEKGGTGKTTTTVNLAAALGEMGKKVLLVDLDGQAASSRWLNVVGDSRFADALWTGGGLEPVEEVLPNVDLAPGHGKLDTVAHDLRPTQGGQLRKVLGELTCYDYVLIDCPPSLGNRLIGNALLAAQRAIVPVETSVLPLDGLKILLTTLADVRDGFGHEIDLAGVLAVRFDGRTRLSHMVLEELHRALPGYVFKTVIRETVRMRECPAAGESILSYAPDCHGAEDYRALATELVEQEVQWYDDDQPVRSCDYGRGEHDHWESIASRIQCSRRSAEDKTGTPPAEPAEAVSPPADTPAEPPEETRPEAPVPVDAETPEPEAAEPEPQPQPQPAEASETGEAPEELTEPVESTERPEASEADLVTEEQLLVASWPDPQAEEKSTAELIAELSGESGGQDVALSTWPPQEPEEVDDACEPDGAATGRTPAWRRLINKVTASI